MKSFLPIKKVCIGDRVAILSPSSAAPVTWPHVYELGIKRLKEEFGLIPVEYPTTKKKRSTADERIEDLKAAFSDPNIKAVITTIGGDDEVKYVKRIDPKLFIANPKPFYGFSDNTHLANFLWMNGIPSYYGGSIFTQYAMEGNIDYFTKKYLKIALYKSGYCELEQSNVYNDMPLDWNDPSTLLDSRRFEENEGWIWDGDTSAEGITWGGCLESIDELLKHGIEIPSLDDFIDIVLMTETSEDIPPSNYCLKVYNELGKRGILSKVKAILNGRPQAWFFDKQLNYKEKRMYKEEQRAIILEIVRKYNSRCSIVQNVDFGHTSPQIPIPYGKILKIDSKNKKIYAEF
ncbi:MAG: S66 peptidase family protein [Candidatus Shapirobacteria bacterium]|jgi:muramoyltetrapeptide carboxypeptidase LdcA involved in peptidoglycan recycling